MNNLSGKLRSFMSGRNLLLLLILALPAAVYFFILAKYALDIPWGDDFVFIVKTLNYDTASERLNFVFTSHGIYRHVFVKLTTLFFDAITGSLNTRTMIFFGNTALIAFTCLLFRQYKGTRYWVLIPIPFIVFNFRFFESGFWAFTSNVNFWPQIFALISFYYLFSSKTRDFIISVFVAALALFTFGNAFFIFIAGGFTLLLLKQYKKLAIWAACSLIICMAFFYGLQQETSGKMTSAIFEYPIKVIECYFVFIGLLFNFTSYNGILMITAGVLANVFYVFLFIRKYYLKNAILFTFLGFLLLTAVVVALSRSEPDAMYGLVIRPRYSFWSCLIWATIYLIIIQLIKEKYLKATVIFASLMTISLNGYVTAISMKFIKDLQRSILTSLAEYKADPATGLMFTVSSNDTINPIYDKALAKQHLKMPAIDYNIISSQKATIADHIFPGSISPVRDFYTTMVDGHLFVRFYLAEDVAPDRIFLKTSPGSIYSVNYVGNHFYTPLPSGYVAIIPGMDTSGGKNFSVLIKDAANTVKEYSAP
jgi:hypothetical protein